LTGAAGLRTVLRVGASRQVEPFHVALVEPDIPPNTGNIARLCAATDTVLHIVGQPGFRMSDRAVKRAGLDYWQWVEVVRHDSCETFLKDTGGRRLFFFSSHAAKPHWSERFAPGDVLVFGSETKGLPAALMLANADRLLTIPMAGRHVRSLNLANAVSIALYEAIRQVRGKDNGHQVF
jgi:tRNA (cytidine/uridine-2'-O-)-methyltransferase